jgi:hypothetical protein
MKVFIRSANFLLVTTLLLCGSGFAAEITIFDHQGEAVAYVDTDEQATVFMWSGLPVAYISGTNIYGFNGKHLGWINQGIIYDHGGYGVGFFKNATTTLTQLESLKGLKQLKPLRALKELEPLQPLFSIYWTNTPLGIFLINGNH